MSTYFEFLILLHARLAAQPVCLPAIQAPAHALNQTTLSKALAVLFTAAWQHPSRLSAWAPCLGAGAGGLLWDSTAAGQLHPTRSRQAACSPLSHQQPQPQPATQCALRTGVCLRTWDASWGVNDELQNIQAILPSSSSSQRFYQRDKTKS